MRIIIDADACPVVRIAISEAKKRGVPVLLICDTSHVFSDEYADVLIVDKGSDSADIALVNRCGEG